MSSMTFGFATGPNFLVNVDRGTRLVTSAAPAFSSFVYEFYDLWLCDRAQLPRQRRQQGNRIVGPWSSTTPSSWRAQPQVCVAHEPRVRKRRGALSGLSGQRHGHWCRVRAPSSARRSRPSDLFQPYISILLVLTRCYNASLQRQTSYLFSWMFVFITLCMNGVLLQRRRLDTYTAGRVRCAQGSATH